MYVASMRDTVKTLLKLTVFMFVAFFFILMNTATCMAQPDSGDELLAVTNSDVNSSKDQSSPQFFIAPVNPAFVEYQKELEESQGEQSSENRQLNTLSYDVLNKSINHEDQVLSNNASVLLDPQIADDPTYKSGLQPSPIDFSYLSPVDIDQLLADENYPMAFSTAGIEPAAETFPSRFDLREQGGVTGVRDQAFAGTCWAHGSLGSLESYLLYSNSENWDFSENHMKNTLVSSYQDGFDQSSPDEGGTSLKALAYFARWDGPVAESDDPYNDLSPVSSSDVVVAKHVQETFILPSLNQSFDLYKWIIMNYGAVSIAMYEDDDHFYNEKNSTYYFYEESLPLTHGITLVGWDDDFDRNRFTPAAPGDGAYIIKNSWGDNWGEEGYFYISYYDTAVGTAESQNNMSYAPMNNFLFMTENASNYDHIYQYDPLGWSSTVGIGTNTVIGANIFTAESDETLEAVSFYTTDSNSFYNISVYLDPEDGPINTSGPVSVKNGSEAFAGYHTVNLDTDISLSAGQNFSVVIFFTTPEYTYPVAIESPLSGYSSINIRSEPGQSYASADGVEWTDLSLYNSNACIKAFTTEDRGPEAGFVADKRYVHVNEPVNFHDASLFSPESWEWDFGNNSTSTEQNPSHTYSSTGIYNVSLNTSNEFGSNVTTRSSFIQVLNTTITVNSSGNADFTHIQDAIVAASEGDTIIVEPGTYTERLSFRKDNLTLRSSTGNPADVNIISSNPDKNDPSNFAVFMMADNITLQGVTVSGGYYGVFPQLSNNCSIIDCRMVNNSLSGLFIYDSYNNTILNCTMDNNTAGLYISDSANNYFVNNSMFGNIRNCALISHKDIIDTSNTVEGKPIYYLSGVSDVVIDRDSNAGLVHLADCSNITVKDIDVEKNFYGIYLHNTSNSKIINSTSSKNIRGVHLEYSTNNTVFNCSLENSSSYGISLTESNDNLIYNNYFNSDDNVLISGTLSNRWNIPVTPGRNIIGGDYIGGNYWAKPDGTGWSQVNSSIGDGFCHPYNLSADGSNTDHLPLTLNTDPLSGSENNANVDSVSQGDGEGVNIRRTTLAFYDSNIISVESDMRFIGQGTEVNYEFNEKENPVTHIRFQAKTTEGYVVADVSRLDGPHEGTYSQPSGHVYQNLEITLGDTVFVSSGFMDEAVIGFNVPGDWMESNNIDESTIRLEHYTNDRWEKLSTEKVRESDGLLYFEAVTKGFSPFAICADTVEMSDEIDVSLSGDNGLKPQSEDKEIKNGSRYGNIYALSFLLFIVFISSVLIYRRYRKQDE